MTDGNAPSNRVNRAFRGTRLRLEQVATRPREGGRAVAVGPGTTSLGGGTTATSLRPGFRTEVEVLTFPREPAEGLRDPNWPGPPPEAAISVGGLVYGVESGRWVFYGIRETYLKAKLDEGSACSGQVLAISDADARVIQRNLHASVGRRTYRLTGVCTGGVARKLRQYLKFMGTWGARPVHPLDLGRQVDTRGWVIQRKAYPAAPPRPPPPPVRASRPRGGTFAPARPRSALVPPVSAVPRTRTVAPPAAATAARAAPARARPATAPAPATAALRAPQVPAPRGLQGATRDAIIKPIRAAVARGRALLGGAMRSGARPRAAPKPSAEKARAPRVPRTLEPRGSAATPRGEVPRAGQGRPEARITVKMQLRPPSQAPPARPKGRAPKRGGGDTGTERRWRT